MSPVVHHLFVRRSGVFVSGQYPEFGPEKPAQGIAVAPENGAKSGATND